MKKRTRKRLVGACYCFLTAAFIVSFLWAQGALVLAKQGEAYATGYAFCAYQNPIQPLQERTGNTQPIWATPLGETWLMKEY